MATSTVEEAPIEMDFYTVASPSLSKNQAYDNALEAVQIYLDIINNNEEKIDEFKDIVNAFCWEAKKVNNISNK